MASVVNRVLEHNSHSIDACNHLRILVATLQPLRDFPFDAGWLLGRICMLVPSILDVLIFYDEDDMEAVQEAASRFLCTHGAVNQYRPVWPFPVVDVASLFDLLRIIFDMTDRERTARTVRIRVSETQEEFYRLLKNAIVNVFYGGDGGHEHMDALEAGWEQGMCNRALIQCMSKVPWHGYHRLESRTKILTDL